MDGCWEAQIREMPDFIGERGGTRTLDPMIKSHSRRVVNVCFGQQRITGSPDKAKRSVRLGLTEKQASGPADRTDRKQAMIAVKRATILLRMDWLTGLIGALLW